MVNYIGVIGTVDKVRGHTASYFVQHRERKNKPKDTKNLPEIQSKHALNGLLYEISDGVPSSPCQIFFRRKAT